MSVSPVFAHSIIRLIGCSTMLAVVGLSSRVIAADPPERVRFNEHVRPILSDRCFMCHGPDEKHRDSDLRLDTFDGAAVDLGGYSAVVPGKPDESELLVRVASEDDDMRMPPPSAKKPPLTADEIAVLRRWIEQGAEYEGHWAFLPLRDEQPPDVSDESWIRNPIDRFILARLESEGIRPSREADRATLIRRVYIDLLGLLPPPDEVERFVDDRDPQAFERLVDRLLESPHYGERWGRYWLDQARYADSNGYTSDGEREVWPYRDWVIQALNDDMPFDQFTIEQLAGDLLPNPTKSQLVATGFHRNTLINQEGGTDREQFRVESVMDRTSTTGAVWLGLTIGCAQCHTHKFDPITQREYYQMFAFFNSTVDANDRGPTVDVARGEMFGTLVDGPKETPQLSPAELAKLRKAWEAKTLARLEQAADESDLPPAWSAAKYIDYDTPDVASFRLLDDNSLLLDGRVAPHAEYRVVAASPLNRIASLRLRVLTHESLPKNGPGRAANGNFVLTDFKISIAGVEQRIVRAEADHEQPSYSVVDAIDADPKTGWAINVGRDSTAKMNANHEAIFVLEHPIEIVDGANVTIQLQHGLHADYLVGRFAIDFSDTVPPLSNNGSRSLLTALRTAEDHRSDADTRLVQAAFARGEPQARPPQKQSNSGVAQQMVMRELPQPRPTYLLTRGDFTRPDKDPGVLMPGVLDCVPPALAGDVPRTRLDLARWLVHPDNPLTPRVTMNRVWMRYFGRGLVTTEEDFGTQGTPPTHPALLDWLGREFMRRGWSLKAMHRLIATSATYRQSSKARNDLANIDARNLLLARQERLRFDAEVVRDAALTASGLLNPAIGGPSVHPVQPDGVYSFTQVAKRWNTETDGNQYRRAMYTFYYRSAPYPLFTTFDAPDFQSVCTRRARSNTPLQSLTMANDEAFFEAAQALALRLARELPGDADEQLANRIDRAFLIGLSRPPSATEAALLSEYYQRQLADFEADLDAAGKLMTPDLSSVVSRPDGAALVCVARAILNTDNFITRE